MFKKNYTIIPTPLPISMNKYTHTVHVIYAQTTYHMLSQC